MLHSVTKDFEAKLRTILPAAAFKDDTAPYLNEPRGRWAGQGLVVAPGSTDEVAAVVKACAAGKVGIVPYSGGTGLVGGQLLQDGAVPVVLSLERMNRIRDIYPVENVLVCDAGVILSDVQKAAEGINRLFPLSLASEGSARIGGLLSTNAGGGIMQFFDRDFDAEMASVGMEGLQEFMVFPDNLDDILARLEETRQRIYQ